jgi:putative transcriptional regulator
VDHLLSCCAGLGRDGRSAFGISLGFVFVKNRLEVLRAETDLSQAPLADQLGVSRQTINAIETGRYDPSLPLAFRLAALFGLHIEDIFDPEVESVSAD